MDEKTEELRDIFMDVSDEETVTETQTETPGSLVGGDDEDVDEQLRDLVGRLRANQSFETGLAVDQYVDVVRAFYADASDETIAADLDLPTAEVFAARLDLHLLRESDTDAPFELATLRRRGDADDETLAGDLNVDTATVARYRRVVAAQDAARRSNHRYQQAFDELLTDADLEARFTEGQEDGLEEAAEDIETDVSF